MHLGCSEVKTPMREPMPEFNIKAFMDKNPPDSFKIRL